MKLQWSCDERDRKNCRNAHGCHCREITALLGKAKSSQCKHWPACACGPSNGRQRQPDPCGKQARQGR